MALSNDEIVRMIRQQEEAYKFAMLSQQQGMAGLAGGMAMQQAIIRQDPFARTTPEVQPEKNPKLLLLL